jgi:hypothetical protein
VNRIFVAHLSKQPAGLPIHLFLDSAHYQALPFVQKCSSKAQHHAGISSTLFAKPEFDCALVEIRESGSFGSELFPSLIPSDWRNCLGKRHIAGVTGSHADNGQRLFQLK